MADSIENILKEYVNGITQIFRDKLKKVILFGSHARGDYEEYSDIDVMILVNMTDEEIKEKVREVVRTGCQIDTKYDVVLSPIIKDINQFNHWLSVVPFYKNVMNEGIVLHG